MIHFVDWALGAIIVILVALVIVQGFSGNPRVSEQTSYALMAVGPLLSLIIVILSALRICIHLRQ